MADIVVLGSGLGGTLMAYELERIAGPGDRVTVIGQEHRYHFVPSNPWVAIGWRERTAIEVDLSEVMARKRIAYRRDGAKRVIPEESRVELNDDTSVPYDYLVIATGAELAFDEIAGMGPNAHTQSICHVDHAQRAHVAFEEFIRNPGPIVVGAAQGASCFGPAYEFVLILDTELRRRRIRDKVPMTFVTSEPYIGHLGLDGVGDTKGLLEKLLRERTIKWITNARVCRVEPGRMTVDEMADDGSLRKTHTLPFAYSMMVPAFRGVAALRGIAGLTDPRGFVVVDRNQRSPTFPNVFAIGVCVAIPPLGPTAVPVGVPKTGFMIECMATAAARNIGALLKGESPADQASCNAVCLADFGDRGVLFVAEPEIPPRNLNWSAEGRWVHFAKIAFEKYFLHKIRRGLSEPFYERWILEALGICRLTRAR